MNPVPSRFNAFNEEFIHDLNMEQNKNGLSQDERIAHKRRCCPPERGERWKERKGMGEKLPIIPIFE